MPWRVVKRDCKQADGKSGSYVVLKVKGDDSTEQSSCHTSKEKAQGSVAARKMSEGRKMKITKRQLRMLIKEEINRLYESATTDMRVVKNNLVADLSDTLDRIGRMNLGENFEMSVTKTWADMDKVDFQWSNSRGEWVQRQTKYAGFSSLQDLQALPIDPKKKAFLSDLDNTLRTISQEVSAEATAQDLSPKPSIYQIRFQFVDEEGNEHSETVDIRENYFEG
jgi:hypothetical protein